MATKQNTQTSLKTRTAQALGQALIPGWYADESNPDIRRALRQAMTRQIESALGGHNLQPLHALATNCRA